MSNDHGQFGAHFAIRAHGNRRCCQTECSDSVPREFTVATDPRWCWTKVERSVVGSLGAGDVGDCRLEADARVRVEVARSAAATPPPPGLASERAP